MHKIFLAVGSNICRRLAFTHAYLKLQEFVTITKASNIYVSTPRGHARGPQFYNSVLAGETALELLELKARLKALESSLGRELWISPSGEKCSLHLLDIDILTYDEVISSDPELPRSDIHKYDFVLRPLAEIAPLELLPGSDLTYEALATQSTLPLKELKAVPFMGEQLIVNLN